MRGQNPDAFHYIRNIRFPSIISLLGKMVTARIVFSDFRPSFNVIVHDYRKIKVNSLKVPTCCHGSIVDEAYPNKDLMRDYQILWRQIPRFDKGAPECMVM